MTVLFANSVDDPSVVMALGPILRARDEKVRDKSYARSPLGREVRRFIRALAWADHPQTTQDSYETTLARLALEHDDFANGFADFCNPAGPEYLRDFLERNWGDSAAATKAQRTAALRSFGKWAVDEGIAEWNPAASIKMPRRRRQKERSAYPQDVLYHVIKAQENLRDQCALQLLGRMGLRKNELRILRVGEIDLIRNLLTVHGKGGGVAVMPLAFETLRNDLYLHIQGDERKQSEYLLYPRTDRSRPMDPASIHRWFKRCLENAGLPTTMTLHELRHTAADHAWRETGNIVIAQMLLRHTNVATTQAYLHPTRRDLSDALEGMDKTWGQVVRSDQSREA